MTKNSDTIDTRTRQAQRQRDINRKDQEREREMSRDSFLRDLRRASVLETASIESDAKQAEALDRARQQGREGNVVSQQDLDDELGIDGE